MKLEGFDSFPFSSSTSIFDLACRIAYAWHSVFSNNEGISKNLTAEKPESRNAC